MRKLFSRAMAVLAIVAGLGVGASAIPAAAAPHAHVHTVNSPAGLDWWW
jgi:hypothetical protein